MVDLAQPALVASVGAPAFSCVGRTTSRSINRLKTKVLEADAELLKGVASPKAKRGQGAAGGEDGHKRPLTSKAREALGLPPEPQADGESPAEPAAAEAQGEEQPCQSPKGDIAFTSLGKDHETFDGQTSVIYKRWMAPDQAAKEHPSVGRYKAHHDFVMERSPKWDFSRTLGRKKPKKLDESFSETTLTTMSTTAEGFSTFGSGFLSRASSTSALDKTSDRQIMMLSARRPDLATPTAIAPGRFWTTSPQFGGTFPGGKEIATPSAQMLDQIMACSHVPRPPEWDIAKVLDRKSMVKTTFFEPAKYKVKYECVDGRLKIGMEHSKQTSQDARLASRKSCEIMANLKQEKPGDRLIADRSLHRDNSCTMPRVTHIREMGSTLDRPPFFPQSSCYHDESDPDIDAEVMHREMTIDRSNLDDYVVTRKDYAPNMASVISRNRGGKGHRLLQGDIGMMHSRGFKQPETSVEIECTVEESKERPSRPRADVGCSFKQLKGRQKGNEKSINLSSLRQPRDLLAADFERSAPRKGFAPRVTANIPEVLRASRSFEALDGFNPAMFDDCLDVDD
eukprot:TRINITY_DN46519_c0_g1_i1.p1 TRINITY_DN46519_c0_g1~~TRINITY_DN46519_c0_g1_i1.p1  ORF type:complete len:567 (+),score=125.32 TRINITY_DN46519_c0_g1_i1:142-1842(+)